VSEGRPREGCSRPTRLGRYLNEDGSAPGWWGEGATSAGRCKSVRTPAGESWRADTFYRAPYNSGMSPARKLPKWLKSLGRVSGRR